MINKLVAFALVALYATGAAVNPARHAPAAGEEAFDLSLGVPEPEPAPLPAPAPPAPPAARPDDEAAATVRAVDRAAAALAAGAERDAVYSQLRYELGRLDVALRRYEAAR